MAVVRGDRIGESQSLNRCSLEAQEFYALFISSVPDDFGRYRHSPAHVAMAMYPRREPTQAVLRRVTRMLAELQREELVATWETDGVTFGQIARWKATGNRYHRTPEPPKSSHVHGGGCLPTAIHRAREWGFNDEAVRLSLLLKELRERRATEAAPGSHLGVERGGDSPSPPSSPSSPGSKKRTSAPSAASWLSPYAEAWTARFEGNVPAGEIAKTFKPLHDRHGQAEVLARWRRYLEQTEGRFASPTRFAQTFGEWAQSTALALVQPRASPKAQERRDAMSAAVVGGLKGDGTLGGSSD